MESLSADKPMKSDHLRCPSPKRPNKQTSHGTLLTASNSGETGGVNAAGKPMHLASGGPVGRKCESAIKAKRVVRSPLAQRKAATLPPGMGSGDLARFATSSAASAGGSSGRLGSGSGSGGGSTHSESQPGSQDEVAYEGSYAMFSSPGIDSSGPISTDEVDDSQGDIYIHEPLTFSRVRNDVSHLTEKISKTKDMIRQEQASRDDNVNEYLKLASSADKQQMARVKSVFEKKNQKSASQIAHLQKKLEAYNKRLRDAQLALTNPHLQGAYDIGPNGHNVGGRAGLPTGPHVFRDVGQGIKTVISKPMEFAHLIKNKFGSADNINNIQTTRWFVEAGTADGSNPGTGHNTVKPSGDHTAEQTRHHGSATLTHSTKYTSEDDCSSITSGSGGGVQIPNRQVMQILSGHTGSNQHSSSPSRSAYGMDSTIHHGSTDVPPESSSNQFKGLSSEIEMLLREVQDRREDGQRMQEEIDNLKSQLQTDINYFNQVLQEERYRFERLEEQVNDLIELHQNEIENVKQNITDMEEKVQYQSEERMRDMNEIIENCQTRIYRIEHQQAQHQQLVNIEGIENSNARALILKLINVLLTFLQVILLLVATCTNILTPFIKTRVRILTSFILIVSAAYAMQRWPELVNWVVASAGEQYQRLVQR